ncbi:MAG: D-mannonate oxidoreductase, partial [Candidatus Omnitrophota bacterium]
MRKDEYVGSLFSLQGKVAVINGGAGVLGLAIAKGLGKAGAKIAIGDIAPTSEAVEYLQKEKVEAKGYFMNALDKDTLKKAREKIIKDFQRVDILLNAAGGNMKGATTSPELSFFDLPLDSLEKVVSLNLFGGAVLPSQVFGEVMVRNEEGGSIINISSMNAFRPLTRIPGYSAAKAAVSNFTQWLASDASRFVTGTVIPIDGGFNAYSGYR